MGVIIFLALIANWIITLKFGGQVGFITSIISLGLVYALYWVRDKMYRT